jgi:hypothetical protein
VQQAELILTDKAVLLETPLAKALGEESAQVFTRTFLLLMRQR